MTIQPSYFSSKHNIFNQYFVKLGWAWTSAIIFYIGIKSRTSGRFSTKNFIIRYCLATGYWFLIMNLFHFVWTFSGTCSIEDTTDFHQCKSLKGRWNGFDISGHCFLLIHSSLYILEELAMLTKTVDKIPGFGLLALWGWMLTTTGIYRFHPIPEIIVGSLFGFSYWISFYVVMKSIFFKLLPFELTIDRTDTKKSFDVKKSD
ncbi:inositol phospholipid synthesis and fat-storage-inducing TM-domain-containing protein [Globomyces pollinis-pini]|nr:inositol phospholipid synthesis and fat-storage-inducing TM-domain-containing protein [Globomyces pollinis-pini]